MNKTVINSTMAAPPSGAITYWYDTTSGVLSFVTVLGSLLVISLISTRRRLLTTANLFVLSLMVADFGIGAFIAPLGIVCKFGLGNWCKSPVLHKVFYNFLLSASITNLCAMTVERYMFVVLPLTYPVYMTPRRAVIALVGAWALALLIHLVPVWNYVDAVDVSQNVIHGYVIFRILLFAILPCVTLALAYARIFLIARRITRQIASQKAQLEFNLPSCMDTQDFELVSSTSFKHRTDADSPVVGRNRVDTYNGTHKARTDTITTTATLPDLITSDQSNRRSSYLAQNDLVSTKDQTRRQSSIAFNLKNSVSFLHHLRAGRKTESNSTSLQRSVKVIGVVILLHELCWSMTIYIAFCYDFNVCESLPSSWAPHLSMLLLFANSAANPVVYALMKKDIREELAKLVKRMR